MVLPTNRIVRINVTSTDVIHGFWVPYLRFKTYAMPDHISSFEVDLKHTGSWPGRCAAFCGLYHATMDFTVRVVGAHTFARWLEQKATTSQVSP
jgi:cytochrome c oxidase subunit 2